MVDDFDDRIDDLLFEASELPYGPARLAIAEEAVRYADAHNQIQRAYDARIELIQTAVFSCAIDRAMVAFAWCQSQVDKNPEKFDQTPLLWSQKWIVNHLPGFPQYSRQQMVPLFHLGRLKEAMQYHKKGYPMISSSKSFLASASDHLLFLVLTDNPAKAVKLFEKHLPWTYTDPDQQHRLLFLSAALRLLQTLEQREIATMKLRLPTTFSGYQSNGLYQTADVRKEIEDLVLNLARRFDQRNGSSGCSSFIQFQQQIAISPFPLSEAKKSASVPSV